jgi:hypothetical protein
MSVTLLLSVGELHVGYSSEGVGKIEQTNLPPEKNVCDYITTVRTIWRRSFTASFIYNFTLTTRHDTQRIHQLRSINDKDHSSIARSQQSNRTHESHSIQSNHTEPKRVLTLSFQSLYTELNAYYSLCLLHAINNFSLAPVVRHNFPS